MNSFNSENVDCPICLDCITDIKNRVTTECGHCFHTNCLMTSVAHNGFGCPYCRTAMAEEVKEEEDSEWGSVDDDEYALRGFRFMFNRLAGEPDDEQDILEENEDNEDNEEEGEQDESKPSAEYITQKLTQQGVTMEQLVKAMLINHDEYENEDTFRCVEGDLFGKLRIIISNYSPEPETPSVPPPPILSQADYARIFRDLIFNERERQERITEANETRETMLGLVFIEEGQYQKDNHMTLDSLTSVSAQAEAPVVDYSSQPKNYRTNLEVRFDKVVDVI